MVVLGLTQEQINLIHGFFPTGCEVKLFGSRVKGGFRELSDLDVCILSEISRSEVAQITELFEESNLPFTVDIVIYKDCSQEFKKIIDITGISI